MRMSSPTREAILRSLRTQGACTVKELADSVGISPVSVRHHLAQLQADGLIATREVRKGVGRPHHQFSLTDQAIELFPTRYYRLTNRLLEEIKSEIPPDRVGAMFSKMAKSIAEDTVDSFEDLPLQERLDHLMAMLSEEGFDAEYVIQGDQIIIRMLTCPYYRLARQHPEVDMIDQALIAKALSLPFERISYLPDGDAHCAFSIQLTSGDIQP